MRNIHTNVDCIYKGYFILSKFENPIENFQKTIVKS